MPTVSSRLPLRFRPVAMGIFAGGSRTSISLRPSRSATASISGTSARRACIPLMMCRPDSSASTSAGTQLRAMNPPEFATPMTSARAPFSRACFGVSLGSPVVTARARQRELADAPLERPVTQSEGRLGIARFDGVAEKQEVGLRQRELQRIFGGPYLLFSSEHNASPVL